MATRTRKPKRAAGRREQNKQATKKRMVACAASSLPRVRRGADRRVDPGRVAERVRLAGTAGVLDLLPRRAALLAARPVARQAEHAGVSRPVAQDRRDAGGGGMTPRKQA